MLACGVNDHAPRVRAAAPSDLTHLPLCVHFRRASSTAFVVRALYCACSAELVFAGRLRHCVLVLMLVLRRASAAARVLCCGAAA
eukprot:3499486-Pleurochrysis_carterae.AAC.1